MDPAGLNSGAKLEPFLLMAKNAKGAAAAKLIADATAAPGVFVFGELLALPAVQDLANHEQHAPALRLLELFAYRTYGDYLQAKDSFPSLNASQTTKLKQLTIASMAALQRVIPYEVLLQALEMPSVRALEDLIIDGIYAGVLRARLDQRAQQLEVVYVLGRDVAPASAPALLAALQDWASTSASVLSTLDTHIAQLQQSAVARAGADEARAAGIDKVLRELQEKKDKSGGGKRGGLGERNAPATRGAGAAAADEDLMDVDDEVAGKGKLRKTARGDENSKNLRNKRNRF